MDAIDYERVTYQLAGVRPYTTYEIHRRMLQALKQYKVQ